MSRSAIRSPIRSSSALDDTLVTLNEEAFDLAPGAEKEISYTYIVKQADVDAGKIDNTITATGKDPKNEDVTAEDSAEVTTVEAKPELTVEKSATPKENVGVDATVTYTVKITNSGNVTVTGIELEDTLVTLDEEAFTLAPADSKTITYTYKVTQDDVDAGQIDNTVTATGKDPKNADVTGTDSATVTTVESDAKLDVVKTAAPASEVKAGDKVTYTVKITNSGNVTVKDIELEDTLVSLKEKAFTLAPGAEKEITYTYTVTQADVDAGKINNTVTATGKDPKDNDVPNSANATVKTVAAEPELTVEKTAEPNSNVKVGDEITYTVVVTNTGNVTVKAISIDDTLVQVNEAEFTLAPEESKTITYNYTVTQADVDAGKIDNTATATGKDPKNEDVTAEDSVEVKAEKAAPELTVKKTADPDRDVKLNDVITYTVTVKNTGNVTIKDIEIDDTLVDVNVDPFTLAPNETKEITYTYTVTQADVDAGKVHNKVIAKGNDPSDEPTPGDDEIDVPTEPAKPEITVEKSSSTEGEVAAGETITYTVKVTNTGNVTLHEITLKDDHGTPTGYKVQLAPKESTEVTYIYTATQADDDAGSVVNTAKATGKAPKGDQVEDEDSVTTIVGHNDIEPTPDPEDKEEEMDAESKSITVMYDGKAHTVSSTAKRPGSTIEYSTDGGATWTTEAPSRTDAGETAFSIRATHPDYKTVTKDGYKLIVTKRPVTLTSASDKKEYDGQPLTKNAQTDITVSGEGFVEGEGAVYDITGSQTEAGKSENTFTYKLNEGTLADNYEITTEFGTLEVTKSAKELKIMSGDQEWPYDGSDHKYVQYTVTYGDETIEGTEGQTEFVLPTSDKITISNPATVQNVLDTEEGNNTFEYELENKDFYENIAKPEPGTLTITPLTVKFISADGEKPYDGSPLTRNVPEEHITIVGELAPTDEVSFEITGSQTLVGESPNKFTYRLYRPDGAEEIEKTSSDNGIVKLESAIRLAADDIDLASNYDVTTEFGTLKVTDKDPGTDEPVPGVVSKTHEGEEYALGETITFDISVKNIYDETKTITLVEIEGMELSQSVFEGVAAGATITATATHVVTEADILNGSVKNEVTAKFSGDDTPDFPGEDEVPVEDPKSHATIDKKVINEKELMN